MLYSSFQIAALAGFAAGAAVTSVPPCAPFQHAKMLTHHSSTAIVENGLSIGLVISVDSPLSTITVPASTVTGTSVNGAVSPGLSSATQNPTLWEVQVGSQNDLSFSPAQIVAATGDTVQFTFFQNHTVTQSSLESPCAPMLGGFNTGFNQYNPSNSDNVQVSFTVNSPEPQFFFCSQTDPVPHCGLGMVFSINAGPSENTFLRNVLASGTNSSIASVTAPFSNMSTATTASGAPSGLSTGIIPNLASQLDLNPLTRTSLISLGSLLGNSETGSGLLSSTLQSSPRTSAGTLTVSSSLSQTGSLQTTTSTSTVPTSPTSNIVSTSSPAPPTSGLTNGNLSIVEAFSPSVTNMIVSAQSTSQGSVSVTWAGKRAVATAEAMLGGGSRSKQSLVGGALIAFIIALAVAVLE